MRRFGQNERSLFSFISSAEPLGLQQHAAQASDKAGHYRIHHFFDYVRLNLLPTISSGNSHTHWGVIESVLASSAVETPEEEAVLKTVAMLSLIDAPDLPATESIVRAAVGGAKKAVNSAIENLRARGIIYERGVVNGLCLWPHTAVNLDELFAKAVEATASKGDGITRLCTHVKSEHLVPRAYYAHTGTLRYAAVELISAANLDELLATQPRLDGKGADLNLWVVVPADRMQQKKARQKLVEYNIYVVEDCCGATSPAAQEAALSRMVQAGATRLTTIAALLEWQRDWAKRDHYNNLMGLLKNQAGAYGVGVEYAYTMVHHAPQSAQKPQVVPKKAGH